MGLPTSHIPLLQPPVHTWHVAFRVHISLSFSAVAGWHFKACFSALAGWHFSRDLSRHMPIGGCGQSHVSVKDG